jgi:hypothetical protein
MSTDAIQVAYRERPRGWVFLGLSRGFLSLSDVRRMGGYTPLYTWSAPGGSGAMMEMISHEEGYRILREISNG